MSSKNPKRRKTRSKILQAFYAWQLSESTADELQKRFDQAGEKDENDYFSKYLYEIIKQQPQIKSLLAQHLDRPIEQIALIEQCILQMGCYSLKNETHIPAAVTITEHLLLTKTFVTHQSCQYINAVLDHVRSDLSKHPDEKA
jgi:transcription antitermination factor NusB